jgi:hypothetical protein
MFILFNIVLINTHLTNSLFDIVLINLYFFNHVKNLSQSQIIYYIIKIYQD